MRRAAHDKKMYTSTYATHEHESVIPGSYATGVLTHTGSAL